MHYYWTLFSGTLDAFNCAGDIKLLYIFYLFRLSWHYHDINNSQLLEILLIIWINYLNIIKQIFPNITTSLQFAAEIAAVESVFVRCCRGQLVQVRALRKFTICNNEF